MRKEGGKKAPSLLSLFPFFGPFSVHRSVVPCTGGRGGGSLPCDSKGGKEEEGGEGKKRLKYDRKGCCGRRRRPLEPVAASASVAAFLPFAKGASASLSPSQAQSFGWGGGEGGQKDAGISPPPPPPPRKAEGIVCYPPKASIPFPDSGRRKEEGGASIAFIFPSQRFLDGKSAVWQAVERRHGHNTQTNSGGGGGGRRREGPGNLYASFFSVRGGHREEPPKWLLPFPSLPFPSLPFPFIDCYISWNHGGQGGGSRRG